MDSFDWRRMDERTLENLAVSAAKAAIPPGKPGNLTTENYWVQNAQMLAIALLAVKRAHKYKFLLKRMMYCDTPGNYNPGVMNELSVAGLVVYRGPSSEIPNYPSGRYALTGLGITLVREMLS